MRSGSSMPGNSTMMRLSPWRVIWGSSHAGFVDAAADDFDRLLHRVGATLFQRARLQRQRQIAARQVVDREFARHRQRNAAQRGQRRVMLGGRRADARTRGGCPAAAPGSGSQCSPSAARCEPNPPGHRGARARWRSYPPASANSCRRADRAPDAPGATAARAPGDGITFGRASRAPRTHIPRIRSVFARPKYIMEGDRLRSGGQGGERGYAQALGVVQFGRAIRQAQSLVIAGRCSRRLGAPQALGAGTVAGQESASF